MPKTDYRKDNFDIDLEFGSLGEDTVLKIFEEGNQIEVKTERGIWKHTGNIAIEIECNGKPSCLSITDANYWIHLLSDNGKIVGGYIIPVDYLRERIKQLRLDGDVRVVMGGDKNASRLVLLPMNKIYR